MKRKNSWLKIAAIATAIVGAVVAVAVYIRKKSKCLSEELDFDNSIYFDEDESLMDEDYEDNYSAAMDGDQPIPETAEEDAIEEDAEEADKEAPKA